MDPHNQPTRLDVDRARQIIGDSTHDAAYRDRREALAWRTLGCVQGLAQLHDAARAIRLIRAALRAERELSALGTPEYDTIMAEPLEQTADRPCLVCGKYPAACTCRIGDANPRYDATTLEREFGDDLGDTPVHTGIGNGPATPAVTWAELPDGTEDIRVAFAAELERFDITTYGDAAAGRTELVDDGRMQRVDYICRRRHTHATPDHRDACNMLPATPAAGCPYAAHAHGAHDDCPGVHDNGDYHV